MMIDKQIIRMDWEIDWDAKMNDEQRDYHDKEAAADRVKLKLERI